MAGGRLNLKRQRGLTLVELLVVIAILALASSVVMLTAPPVRPAVRDDAERFAARTEMALDDMISSGRVLRLSIDPTGYEFEALAGGEWSPPERAAHLSRRKFDGRTSVMLEFEDRTIANLRALGAEEAVSADDQPNGAGADRDKDARTVPLDPLGGQTPFSVRFSSPAGSWVVTVDDAATVSVRDDAVGR